MKVLLQRTSHKIFYYRYHSEQPILSEKENDSLLFCCLTTKWRTILVVSLLPSINNKVVTSCHKSHVQIQAMLRLPDLSTDLISMVLTKAIMCALNTLKCIYKLLYKIASLWNSLRRLLPWADTMKYICEYFICQSGFGPVFFSTFTSAVSVLQNATLVTIRKNSKPK